MQGIWPRRAGRFMDEANSSVTFSCRGPNVIGSLEGNSEWFLRFISSNAPILLNGKARVAFTRYFRLQS